MQDKQLTLVPLEITLSICRLAPQERIPEWVNAAGDFLSITRTRAELSVVCPAGLVPGGIRAEAGWKAFKVQGQLDFGLTGILAAIAEPLAKKSISIFAVSTYDTDYVLVKEADFAAARHILKNDFVIG
ncbi:MAG: ACT domain-containing protein [Peptococcaceae bacterium]